MPSKAASNYLHLAKIRIAEAINCDDLKTWWFGQNPQREMLGIVGGTPEYDDLKKAFIDRGLEMSAKQIFTSGAK